MISVILSTHNDENTISDAINSILNQSYTDLELIIINDCSTDKTKEVIKSFDDRRLIYLENKTNIGRSRSRNKAIKMAKGDFIAIMDGDDISAPNRLDVQFKYLIKNPDVDLVACNVIYFYEDTVLGSSLLKQHKSNIFNFYLRASEMPHPTWMVRANFYKKFKYNPEMDKSEDSDLIFRARLYSKYSLLKDCLVFYRIPTNINISYKLKQVYLLFLSRIKQIYNQKSLYYFPIILFGLLVSTTFYIFGLKNIKMKTSSNSKYQTLLNKLASKRHKTIVNIISSLKGGGAELLVRKLHKNFLLKKLDAHAIYLNGKSKFLEKNEIILGYNSRNPIIIFSLRKLIKKLSYETKNKIIIHAHLTWPFFYTVLSVIGLKNIKLIYTEHATTNKRRKIPFFKIIDYFFYRRYSHVICISDGVKRSILKWVGTKISRRLITINNGSRLFPKILRSSIKKRPPRLISIGSLIYEKNFSTTILAISELRNSIESYTIVGKGNQKKVLKKMIKSLKLEKKIFLLDWSNNIREKLNKADIQLIPSISEGFGLVAVEGMSTGLPIIASNIDGLRETVGTKNNSVIFVKNPSSPSEWVLKIKDMIDHINKSGIKMIANCSQYQAKKFNMSKMTEEYLNVYIRK
jgi:glycosyltransferase involved in cell wall biosynthesis/GT2 family glycosyltransferase